MKFDIANKTYQQDMSDTLELADSDLEAVHGGSKVGEHHHHHHGFGGLFDLFGSSFGYGVPAYYTVPTPAPYPPYYPAPVAAYYSDPTASYYPAASPYGAPAPCGYGY